MHLSVLSRQIFFQLKLKNQKYFYAVERIGLVPLGRNFSDKSIKKEFNSDYLKPQKQQQQQAKQQLLQHQKEENLLININKKMENKTEKIAVDKEELKKRLTPLQYQVTQEAATERPFTGCYNKHKDKGVYQCIVCHQDLFSSNNKYDSGCGWPAFNDVLDQGKVTLHRDASIPEMERTEVRCSKCDAHMGHVFEDGPPPRRIRYCINSASMDFVALKSTDDKKE